MAIRTLGIDLGKNLCSVAGLDASGAVVVRRRLRRDRVLAFTAELVPCIVAMEACCGAHHLARQLAAQGHTIRLMSPEYVRPYVKAQKNDDRDAEAIAEAATRPTMRFVESKSEAQLDLQALHRVRDRLVAERTALLNQIRALLLERGISVPQGRWRLVRELPALLSDEAVGLSPRIVTLLTDMAAEWAAIDRRITAFDKEFAAFAKSDVRARRLASVPGIGPLTASALVAAVGEARSFTRGHDLAAWLGLVPRQATTGGRPRLLGISRRGSKYLRKLLVHGARSALPSLTSGATPLGRWLTDLLARAHKNTVVVALANKLARIAWAVLVGERRFLSSPAMAS